MSSRLCAILLEEDVPVDPRRYGDRVAALLGIPRIEARLRVRQGRGIFLENVPEEEALRLTEELARDGVRSRVVPREQLPPLPRPRKITHLEGGPEALFYKAPDGDAALPWEAILVASCGLVAGPESGGFFLHVPFENLPPLHRLEERDREIVRENLILKISSVPPSEPPPTSPSAGVFEEIERRYSNRVHVYLDLLPTDLGNWLRIPMQEVAYAHAPGRIRMGLSWGFQLLIDDLRRKSPPGIWTEISSRLMNGSDPLPLVFPRMEEFTRHTAWAAFLRHLGPPPSSPGGPDPEETAPPDPGTR